MPTPDKTQSLEKKIQIGTLKKLIEYQKQVRQDRRDQFETWDKNSQRLIEQYEAELRLAGETV